MASSSRCDLLPVSDDGGVDEKFHLACNLRKGDNGVEKDIGLAAAHFRRLIDESNHLGAAVELAKLLIQGEEGVPRDVPEAVSLLTAAIDNGAGSEACFELACILAGDYRGVDKDHERAKDLFRQVVDEDGHVGAMYNLAVLLESHDDASRQDVASAATWYQRAVDEGRHVLAMNNLAALLQVGAEGVPRDAVRAADLYQCAIDEGNHVNAMYNLALLLKNGAEGVPQDAARAAKLYQRAVDEGADVSAMFNLALLLEEGTDGVPKDSGRAAMLFERAVDEGGHVKAMYSLGEMLRCGSDAVPKDMGRALALYQRAVDEGGHFDATFTLGVLLYHGADGVEPNTSYASELLARADQIAELRGLEKGAEKGDLDCTYWLADYLLSMPYVQDRKRAVQVLEQAVSMSCVRSMVQLAQIVWVGHQDVARDVNRALDLMSEAVQKRGGVFEKTMLARWLLSDDIGEMRNPARARDLLEDAAGLGTYPPAIYELAVLLDRGDYGVIRDGRRAQQLFTAAREALSGNFMPVPGLGSFINSIYPPLRTPGISISKSVEKVLREATAKPQQCFMLTLGGAGRGKTSTARSLQGMPFVRDHIPTELASLTRSPMTPGAGRFTDAELMTLMFHSESLSANVSRAQDRFSESPCMFFVASPVVPDDISVNIRHLLRKELTSAAVAKNFEFKRGVRTNALQSSYSMGNGVFTSKLQLPRHRDRGHLTREQFDTSSQCSQINEGKSSTRDESRSPEQLRPSHEPHHNRPPDVTNMMHLTASLTRRDCDADAEESSAHRDHQDFSYIIDKVRLALTDTKSFTGNNTALVQCWDLGGQTQYMMAHAMYVRYAPIVMFVFDLVKAEDAISRREEIAELCHWMRLARAVLHEPEGVYPIMIGTRKGECEDVGAVWRAVREGLEEELGRSTYDVWARERGGEGLCGQLQFVAVENSRAERDREGSGVVELERVLKTAAEQVVGSRGEITTRWIALVEHLWKMHKRSGCVFFTKEEVLRMSEGFPGFEEDEEKRSKDVLDALRYYRSLGYLSLFEVSRDSGVEDYYVFMDPSSIVEFLRQVSGPTEVVQSRLRLEHRRMLRKGLLTIEGLGMLWDGHEERTREVILELLCEYDLLIKLKGGSDGEEGKDLLIGVPCLLEEGWEGFRWGLKEGMSELQMKSVFEDGVPPGLHGLIVAHLGRTLSRRQIKEPELRSDSVIISLAGPLGGNRVVIIFRRQDRSISWIIRSEDVFKIAHECLRALNEFLEDSRRGIRVERKDMILANCPRRGCKGENTVEFEISGRWWREEWKGEVPDAEEGECLTKECGEPWTLNELLPNMLKETGQESFVLRCAPYCAVSRYDVFISHAGPEKRELANPLYRRLSRGGLRCFLDDEELRGSSMTVEEQLEAAMRGSKAAIFIMSVDFASRKWPLREARRFLELRRKARERGEKGPLLMPLFYKLRVEECKDFNLAQSVEYRDVFVGNGFFDEKRLARCSQSEAMSTLKELTHFSGIRNDGGVFGEEYAEEAAAEFMKAFEKECRKIGDQE